MSRSFWLKIAFAGLVLFLTQLVLPSTASAQYLELNGGYNHNTSDFGTDGFSVGAAWWFTPQLTIAANYDSAWDTSRVGDFEFTDLGAIAAKSHLQNFMVGPRFFFTAHQVSKHHQVIPFADVRFGLSHLHQSVQEGSTPPITNADTAFSWMAGGGVDYPLAPHWAARGEMDFLRTHLNASAQSRLRLMIGLTFTFGER